MARIILVIGGTRSGKSYYAQRCGEALGSPRCFVATGRASDKEMLERIEKHRRERSEKQWVTYEEPIDIKRILEVHPNFRTYLIDCLTLWISNLMEQHHKQDRRLHEDELVYEINELIDFIENQSGTFIFVSNEVGMGVVPDNKVARLYRDLVGLCNRLVAERAQEVILVSCGVPLHLKRNN